jgi:hypothetical protein
LSTTFPTSCALAKVSVITNDILLTDSVSREDNNSLSSVGENDSISNVSLETVARIGSGFNNQHINIEEKQDIYLSTNFITVLQTYWNNWNNNMHN